MDRWTLPLRWKKAATAFLSVWASSWARKKLLDAAKVFGFGQSLPLAEGLAAEAGQLPAPQELAQSGQLANFSFGQGSLLATPMQVAALFNTFAADGVYRAPYVLQATLDETTGQPVENLSHPRGRRVIPAQSAALLRTMLVQVVQQGTAQDAAGLSGGAGGKTGTAQTGQFTPEGAERCNLWFAGFCPAEKPRYTIVVLQDGAIHTAYPVRISLRRSATRWKRRDKCADSTCNFGFVMLLYSCIFA